LYQKAPDGLPLTNYPKYCSLDGDADRLIYFFLDENQHFHLLDGDRFSVLFALFISKKLNEANLFDQVKIGVVQTAYANGNSTDYIINTMVKPNVLFSANQISMFRKCPLLVYQLVSNIYTTKLLTLILASISKRMAMEQ